MQESSKNHLNHAESTPKFDFLHPVPDNKPNFCCAQMYSDFLGVSVQFSFGVDLSVAEASRTATTRRALHNTKSFYTRITLYYTGSRTLKYVIEYRI